MSEHHDLRAAVRHVFRNVAVTINHALTEILIAAGYGKSPLGVLPPMITCCSSTGVLSRSCVRKIQSVDQEFFVLLLVSVRPFLASLFPRKLAAFFTFDPLVPPDLFFEKVGDPLERIGIY